MVEAAAAITIAICSGLGVLTSRLHNRILMLDKRIDQVELRVASSYITREEVSSCLDRIDSHILRIEDKLDNLGPLHCAMRQKQNEKNY